jgi:hypothetical protein
MLTKYAASSSLKWCFTLPGVYLRLPCIWECKALSQKNFRAVARNGLAKTYPHYATQLALYQWFLKKTLPALYTIIDANTMEALHFAVPFDEERAKNAIDRIAVVLDATTRGELLPRAYVDPSDFRCKKFHCGHMDRCWRNGA